MTLYDKIIKLYPELANYDFAFSNITLQDDGEGAYIKEWNHPTLPRPTEQELS